MVQRRGAFGGDDGCSLGDFSRAACALGTTLSTRTRVVEGRRPGIAEGGSEGPDRCARASAARASFAFMARQQSGHRQSVTNASFTRRRLRRHPN
jgi:hypothetical protein